MGRGRGRERGRKRKEEEEEEKKRREEKERRKRKEEERNKSPIHFFTAGSFYVFADEIFLKKEQRPRRGRWWSGGAAPSGPLFFF